MRYKDDDPRWKFGIFAVNKVVFMFDTRGHTIPIAKGDVLLMHYIQDAGGDTYCYGLTSSGNAVRNDFWFDPIGPGILCPVDFVTELPEPDGPEA